MDLVLSCYLNPSGLSRAAREYYRIFSESELRVLPLWFLEPTPEGVDPELSKKMMGAAGRPINKRPVQFYVGSAYGIKVLKDREALLGSVVFENHRLLPRQIQSFRAMDIILPPSNFCLKACIAAGLPKSKIRLLPYPIGEEYKVIPPPSIPREGIFRFLYLNTWYERKGPDVLLKAWWRTFKKSDPVELWIKTYKEEGRVASIEDDISRLAVKYGADRSNEAKINIIDKVLSDAELPSFMRSFDCHVSPHRSEGFGMNVWHAMALGIPVICTDYGGVTDFAKRDTARLIPVEKMTIPGEAEATLFPHLAGIEWAEPSADGLCRHLIGAVTNFEESAKKAENARNYILKRYDGKRILSEFEEIMGELLPDAWSTLSWTRTLGPLVNQESPRFESANNSIRMVEI